MADELCTTCGAPRAAGYAACKFCKTPFVANTQTGAIPCPRCSTLNEMGAQKCVQCQAWVVVQCVFCHALSPHNVPGCLKCGEAFAGAPARLAEQQRAQHLQQGLNIAGTVGNVAASFLGAAVGSGAFSGNDGYEHHHHHHYEQREDSGAGGFLGSLFGGNSSGDVAPATTESSGGGFFDSILGGSSDSSSSSDDSSSSSDDDSSSSDDDDNS